MMNKTVGEDHVDILEIDQKISGQNEMENDRQAKIDEIVSKLASKSNKTKKKTETIKEDDKVKSINASFEEIFSPSNWEGIVSAPANTMLAKTGHEHWNMKEQEVKKMASLASLVSKQYINDPKIVKHIPLIMLSATLFMSYGMRYIMEVKIQKKEKEESKKDEVGGKS